MTGTAWPRQAVPVTPAIAPQNGKTREVRKQINSSLKIIGFIPTQYLKSNKTEQRVLELIEEQLKAVAPILPPLPRATAIAEATEYGMPFALTPKKTKGIINLFDSYAQHLQNYWTKENE